VGVIDLEEGMKGMLQVVRFKAFKTLMEQNLPIRILKVYPKIVELKDSSLYITIEIPFDGVPDIVYNYFIDLIDEKLLLIA